MKKIRLLSLVLSIMLVLCACGKPTEPPAPQNAEKTEKAEDADAPGSNVVILVDNGDAVQGSIIGTSSM